MKKANQKSKCAAFILSAAILLSQTIVFGGNIIQNGEFDTYPSYWSGWIDAANVITALSKDTNSVLSGKNSLLLDITEGGSDYWGIQRVQNARLETDYDYTMAFMGVKEDGPDSAAVHMLFEISADPYTKYFDETFYVVDTPRHFGPYLFIPVNDDPLNQFKLFFGGTDNVKIWVDSVVVLKVGPVWRNVEIDPISDPVTAEWRMTPSHSPMNGVVGLSEGEVSYTEDLSCVVRFNTDGYIDVSNGGDFMVDDTVYYAAGIRYDITADVNVPNGKYSVAVKPQNGDEKVIATNYDFQAPGDPLDHLVINTELDPTLGGVEDSHIDVTGFDTEVSVDGRDAGRISVSFHLEQNYPNPFNPKTAIRFYLPVQSKVSLQIFDVMGRFVKDFGPANYGAGEHVVNWDATDMHGTAVPSGVYTYRLNAGPHSANRKMLLLK
jgi:hypothetical protein